MKVLADTGPLYALMDRDDTWHSRVAEWWAREPRQVLIPVTVLPEVSYLLQTRIGTAAEQAFVQAVAQGEFVTEPLEPGDIARAAELMREYTDLPLGFVDASLAAIAERLGIRQILTTDRRHFGVVRPRHTDAFTLLP